MAAHLDKIFYFINSSLSFVYGFEIKFQGHFKDISLRIFHNGITLLIAEVTLNVPFQIQQHLYQEL